MLHGRPIPGFKYRSLIECRPSNSAISSGSIFEKAKIQVFFLVRLKFHIVDITEFNDLSIKTAHKLPNSWIRAMENTSKRAWLGRDIQAWCVEQRSRRHECQVGPLPYASAAGRDL